MVEAAKGNEIRGFGFTAMCPVMDVVCAVPRDFLRPQETPQG